MRRRGIFGLVGVVTVFTVVLSVVSITRAAEPTGGFSLDVTPSPLIATLKPGTTTSLDLKIRNTGTTTEELKIEPRSFKVDNRTGEVVLEDTTPPDIAGWIDFSAPKFTVKSGEWYTEKVTIALPQDTGFSYSFVLVISRANDPGMATGQVIKGSLAVFTLISVDRPGATRQLEVEKFTTTSGIYEYLPATLDIQFKNTGNTIVQPYGNVFIQRGSNDAEPIATLPVNDKKGYILPGSNRTLQVSWENGFPTYQTSVTAAGQTTNESWNWSKLSDFRIGRYTAKLVAVYNDGQRDVPIVQEVSFWVFPWKIILGGFIVLVVLGFGLWSVARKIWGMMHPRKHRKLRL